MDIRGVCEIGSGLQLLTNNNLCRLVLRQGIVDDDAATALAYGLHSNVNIHYLDISHNSISPDGVIILLKKKIHCLTTLTRLYLSYNNIGSDGATALANQLQYLTQLRELNLSRNNIGPSGAVSLANTLHHLTNLRTVDLSRNNIDLHSAIAVITASKDCPLLSYIYLNTADVVMYFTSDYYRVGIHVEGLVSPEDNTAITDLMAATQNHTIQRNIRLGFEFVTLDN